MLTLGDVQKDAVDKEEERFDVEVLTPGETQVEEELSEAFVVNALPVPCLCLQLLFLRPFCPSFVQPCLLLVIHELLIS